MTSMKDMTTPEGISIANVMPVWVVTACADRTEGRGPSETVCVTKLEATAKRMAKGRDVQGTDARVHESLAIGITWMRASDNSKCSAFLMAGNLIGPTPEDERQEKVLQAKRQQAENRKAALDRARELGLSDADIKALKGEG